MLDTEKQQPIMESKDLHLFYGESEALKGINMAIGKNEITALIGPSGCGKSTFLKTLNRMNDLIPSVRITGNVTLQGKDIFALDVDVTNLRRQVGMVFQKPNPFPMSIFDNIAYGPQSTISASAISTGAAWKKTPSARSFGGTARFRTGFKRRRRPSQSSPPVSWNRTSIKHKANKEQHS